MRDVGKPHRGGKANARWGDLKNVTDADALRGAKVVKENVTEANALGGARVVVKERPEANALWGAKAVAKERDEAKTQQHGGKGKREITKKHSTGRHSRQVQQALANIGAKGMGRNASAAPEWEP